RRRDLRVIAQIVQEPNQHQLVVRTGPHPQFDAIATVDKFEKTVTSAADRLEVATRGEVQPMPPLPSRGALGEIGRQLGVGWQRSPHETMENWYHQIGKAAPPKRSGAGIVSH